MTKIDIGSFKKDCSEWSLGVITSLEVVSFRKFKAVFQCLPSNHHNRDKLGRQHDGYFNKVVVRVKTAKVARLLLFRVSTEQAKRRAFSLAFYLERSTRRLRELLLVSLKYEDSIAALSAYLEHYLNVCKNDTNLWELYYYFRCRRVKFGWLINSEVSTTLALRIAKQTRDLETLLELEKRLRPGSPGRAIILKMVNNEIHVE